MKTFLQSSVVLLLSMVLSGAEPPPNPQIDYEGFQAIVEASGKERAARRLTEEQFLQAMQAGDSVLLDARSASFYGMRHLRGAVNLPFTEFTGETLARMIPEKSTRILIYCNNNFADSPGSFPSKIMTASLNLSTYTSLRAYGYTNIYELGPYLKIGETRLPFAGREVQERSRSGGGE